MGVLLGLMRTPARAAPGARAYDFKPFYRGSKVSVIGAISVSTVLAVMTRDESMDAAAFEVYVSKCRVPQLWKGAVVVMDNLISRGLVKVLGTTDIRMLNYQYRRGLLRNCVSVQVGFENGANPP